MWSEKEGESLSYMTGGLIGAEPRKHTLTETPRYHKGIDCHCALMGQGTPMSTSKPPEA